MSQRFRLFSRRGCGRGAFGAACAGLLWCVWALGYLQGQPTPTLALVPLPPIAAQTPR